MSATLRQIDLIGKLDRIAIAMKEALEMPDCKYIGCAPALLSMNAEMRTKLMELREEIEHPKARKNPFGLTAESGQLRGGTE